MKARMSLKKRDECLILIVDGQVVCEIPKEAWGSLARYFEAAHAGLLGDSPGLLPGEKLYAVQGGQR